MTDKIIQLLGPISFQRQTWMDSRLKHNQSKPIAIPYQMTDKVWKSDLFSPFEKKAERHMMTQVCSHHTSTKVGSHHTIIQIWLTSYSILLVSVVRLMQCLNSVLCFDFTDFKRFHSHADGSDRLIADMNFIINRRFHVKLVISE